MSFIETPRFPEDISVGSRGGPQYNTTVVVVDGGAEYRNKNWSYPRHAWNVAYGVNTKAQLDELIAYFHAMAGRSHGFRYKDWHDYKSCISTGTVNFTDQNIGTGDGADTTFQLKKTYAKGALSQARLITKPVSGTVRIGIDGVEKTITTDFTVDTTTGIVTFVAAPGIGLAVTAGFEFDVPARFNTDALEVTLEDIEASAAQVPVIELRV